MNPTERARLEKVQLSLLLAVSDMNQAIAAAHALQEETDGWLARALETAMTVCYMRPFTKADLALPPGYLPTEGEGKQIHQDLKKLRDKEYAHTDKASHRKTRDFGVEVVGEIAQIRWEEGWRAYPRQNLPLVIEHCERMADEFQADALKIHIVLMHG